MKNCNMLLSELGNVKTLHMPTKIVKLPDIRKHKVQPWMNNVLLRKINKKSDKNSKSRCKLYITKKPKFNENVDI